MNCFCFYYAKRLLGFSLFVGFYFEIYELKLFCLRLGRTNIIVLRLQWASFHIDVPQFVFLSFINYYLRMTKSFFLFITYIYSVNSIQTHVLFPFLLVLIYVLFIVTFFFLLFPTINTYSRLCSQWKFILVQFWIVFFFSKTGRIWMRKTL